MAEGSVLTKTGRTIRGRYALSNPDAQIVHAGHLQANVFAKAVGKREYLMLEDADLNWGTGRSEGTGQYTSKPAVLIDGFPVDIPTARLYENYKLLKAGTVDAAPVIEAPDFEMAVIPDRLEGMSWSDQRVLVTADHATALTKKLAALIPQTRLMDGD